MFADLYVYGVWSDRHHSIVGATGFFLILVSHSSLENYYKIMWSLWHMHHYAMQDQEMMIPWERDIYIGLLLQHQQDERDKQKA